MRKVFCIKLYLSGSDHYNGHAGKTTLIGAVCGLVRPTSGSIRAFGHDLASDWRRARSRIGLVPQELSTDMFEPVHRAVSYSRGLFGLAPDRDRIEEILRSLSLWDKRDERIMALSGGMKRRSPDVPYSRGMSQQNPDGWKHRNPDAPC